MAMFIVFLLVAQGLFASSDPHEVLKKYYLQPPEVVEQKSANLGLVAVEKSQISYGAELLEELQGTETEIREVGQEAIRSYWVDLWQSRFQRSEVQQNGDITQHLQVFHQNSSKRHLFAHLFPTQTTWGEVYGAYLLAAGATSDILEITRRQQKIQAFSRDQNRRRQVFYLLASMKDSERFVHVILNEETVLKPNLSLKHFPSSLWSWPHLILKNYHYSLGILYSWISIKTTFEGFLTVQTWGVRAFFKGALQRAFSVAWGLLNSLVGALSGYEQYRVHVRLDSEVAYLKEHVVKIRLFLQNVLELSQFHELGLSDKQKETMRQIISQDESSVLPRGEWVKLYVTLVQLIDLKLVLEQVIFKIAELDFYLGVAQEIATSQNYSYVKFIDAKEAYLKFTALKHPELERDKSVANDVSLDSNKRWVVLSGENASGKSTLMRAIGVNVLYLAQTLGIASAQELNLVPFEGVHAFMEVEDILGKSSSYETELDRMMDALRYQGKRLLLADELFSSTNSREAYLGSREILLKLASFRKNSVGYVSTHLKDLNQLIDEHMAIRNEHMKAFKLFDGPADSQNAMKIFREQF